MPYGVAMQPPYHLDVPSSECLREYFATLGLTLEDSGEIGELRWHLSGKSPLGDVRFTTRLALWSRWLDLAAFRISERAKSSRFIAMFEAADQEQRMRISAALDDYMLGRPAPLITDQFSNLPGRTTDQLPQDWQHQLAEILQSGDERSFATIITDTFPDC